jgi:VCBS repeat-containing protein
MIQSLGPHWAPVRLTIARWLLLAVIVLLAMGHKSANAQSPAQPTGLATIHRHGQSFLTWQERSELSGERYRVYRHTAPIDAANLAAATLLYEVPEGSALFFANRYKTYSSPPWAIRHTERYIIADLAPQLDAGTGLLVWTLADADFGGFDAGDAYYAVTTVAGGVENTIDFAAGNRAGPVAESLATPQPVLIRNQADGWQVYIQYMDLRVWNPSFHAPGPHNEYYGLISTDYGVAGALQYAYDYALYLPDATRCGGALPETLPVFVSLHAWAGNGYSPTTGRVGPWCAYILTPIDQGESWWFGFARDWNYRAGVSPSAGNVIVNYTEQRVLQMIDHLLRHPPGPPANSQRVYVSGHSMGGGGTVALALRYPQIFAAANASKPVTQFRTLSGWTGNVAARWGSSTLNLPVDIDAPNGWADHLQPFANVGVWDWQDFQADLANRVAESTTPLNLDFGVNDTSVVWSSQGAPFFPVLEESRQSWAARVGNDGHNWGAYSGLAPNFYLDAANIPFAGLQTVRDESVPAFRQSSSDPALPPTATGAFHHTLLWSSSWLPWDGAPLDAVQKWQVSVCATGAGNGAPACGTGVTQTVSITPRRLQHFVVQPDTPYYWQNQAIAGGAVVASGVVTADQAGRLTTPAVQITPTGNRIMLLAGQSEGSAELALSDVAVAPGAQASVVLTLSPTELPVYSLDIRIAYDPAAVTPVSVQKGSATADSAWISAVNLATPGLIRAGLATGSLPLSNGGNVLTISFQALASAQVSALTLLQGDLNEGSIPVSLVHGSVVINSPPTAANDAYDIAEDNRLTRTSVAGVLSNDLDGDGHSLAATLAQGVQHGQLVLALDGSFVYTPAQDYHGVDSFTYTATDSLGGAASANVIITVTPVNDPPQADAGGPYLAAEGGSISLGSVAIDVDDLPANLSFAWDLDGNGSFEAAGSNPIFNATGRDGPSAVSVTLRVSDDDGASDTATSQVQIANAAPTAHPGGPYVVDEGGGVSLDASASSDPGGAGDPLSYAWDLNDDGVFETAGATPVFSAATLPGAMTAPISLRVSDDDGGASPVASTTVAVRDVVQLSLPEATALPGAIAAVPLLAEDMEGDLADADVTVSFDPAIASFLSAETGELSAGWLMTTSALAPGQVRLTLHAISSAAAQTDGSPAFFQAVGGSLALLHFQATGGQGASSALTIVNALLNHGGAMAQTDSGSFSIGFLYDISGHVRFWQGSRPVVGATLTASGGSSASTLTNADGAYTLSALPTGAHTVTPAKTDQINGVTAFDAALALRHSVGLALLVGYAASAADVTGSGDITAADASLILRRSVEETGLQFPASGPIWRFDPASRVYANLDAHQSGQDYTALLMGDASGNWSGATLSAMSVAIADAPLTIEVASEADGAVISLRLTEVAAPVYGVDLALRFRVGDWSLVEITPTPATADWMMAWSEEPASLLRIGMANAEPLAAPATLLTVRVRTPEELTVDQVEPTLVSVNENVLLYTPSHRRFLPFVMR